MTPDDGDDEFENENAIATDAVAGASPAPFTVAAAVYAADYVVIVANVAPAVAAAAAIADATILFVVIVAAAVVAAAST